jgi:hypoxanthine phosphoribosyltransferase
MTTQTTSGRVRSPGTPPFRRIVFSEELIRDRVRELAGEIEAHYDHGEPLTVLGLLKGSFIFLSDLIRSIRRPLHVDFVVASSYGHGTRSSGEVTVHYGPRDVLEGRHILLVEDIIDSGTTLNHLIPLLRERNPAGIEVCTLLHKRLTRTEPEPRWVGFDAPREFLVGYGLDHAEDFRHLPFIASL